MLLDVFADNCQRVMEDESGMIEIGWWRTLSQKMVAVQGSPSASTPLIFMLTLKGDLMELFLIH
jgi:hypothetical protein